VTPAFNLGLDFKIQKNQALLGIGEENHISEDQEPQQSVL